jgi:hypothetical protein
MDKEKINEILKEVQFLNNQERVFLTKKLIKWTASDMRVQANAIKNLTSQLDSAGDCINRMRIDLADFKAKEALSALKYAERKLKENGGLGVSYLVDSETGEPIDRSDMRGVGQVKNKCNDTQCSIPHPWDRDDEGFNILKEFGCAAAKNIDKMITKEP